MWSRKKLNSSYDKLKSEFAAQVDVPPDRRFLGFDAYRQAMDSMKAGDVVILGTPPGLPLGAVHARDRQRPAYVHGEAGHRGRTYHAPHARTGDLAIQKNLKVGVGLMVRHCRARQELLNRIRDGEIGDIVAMRAYRMGQGGGTAGPTPAGVSELT